MNGQLVEWTNYEALATMVLTWARRDFLAAGDTLATESYQRRIRALVIRVRAGAFLLERTDPLTALWFGCAGLSLTEARQKMPPSWALILDGLRRQLTDERRRYNQRKRAA